MPLKKVKLKLLAFLDEQGIDESGSLIVASVRQSRDGRVGYYSSMSQFRGRARIVVDHTAIRSYYESSGKGNRESVIQDEIFRTVAHEYGHIIAEAIRVHNRMPEQYHFDVPDWHVEFDDEEDFAEDFAVMVVDCRSSHEEFWERFLPLYAKEFNRLFVDDEQTDCQLKMS